MHGFRVFRFRTVGIHLLRARMIIWRRQTAEVAAPGTAPVQNGSARDWRWSHLAAAVAAAGILAPTAPLPASNHPYPPLAPPPPPA